MKQMPMEDKKGMMDYKGTLRDLKKKIKTAVKGK